MSNCLEIQTDRVRQAYYLRLWVWLWPVRRCLPIYAVGFGCPNLGRLISFLLHGIAAWGRSAIAQGTVCCGLHHGWASLQICCRSGQSV